MQRFTLITTIAAIAPMLASVPADAQTYARATTALAYNTPPAAWQDQDPAVSLYRNARSELNDGNYKKAASLFGEITRKYPRSTYTPDAYYWQGFALYKAGEFSDARAALELQQKSYTKAVTARDGKALLARVNGELAKRGDTKAAETVTREGKRAPQGCPRGDDDVRAEALNAFLSMNSEQAVPLLKQILARRDECSIDLRRKAVFLVSQKRGPEVEDILLGAARQDPDKEVRSQAVFWLSQVNSDRAVTHLEQILKSSEDRDVRDKAIFALSQHNSERASQIIRDFAINQGAPAELREKAVFWLGQRKGSGDFLKSMFMKERSAELKDKIIFALSQQRGNESWLMDLATNNSENMELRKKALFWAGQSKTTSLPELAALYDRVKEREMKDQLIFVYSQRREREAADKLMSIAKTEPDRELRKKAIFWLSQSKDPRVAEFLMQLVSE